MTRRRAHNVHPHSRRSTARRRRIWAAHLPLGVTPADASADAAAWAAHTGPDWVNDPTTPNEWATATAAWGTGSWGSDDWPTAEELWAGERWESTPYLVFTS
ncbi:hypothetical protein K438DRAFT_1976125 [Mycena galopus ATCC 62051]|nr:hypothetical protein K438DRAFT_1976125 [Mycena galopus ATCC 62051]